MINPLQTAAMQKFAIRKTKADKVDAFVIAKALMTESDARVLLRFFETFLKKYRLYDCKANFVKGDFPKIHGWRNKR